MNSVGRGRGLRSGDVTEFTWKTQGNRIT